VKRKISDSNIEGTEKKELSRIQFSYVTTGLFLLDGATVKQNVM